MFIHGEEMSGSVLTKGEEMSGSVFTRGEEMSEVSFGEETVRVGYEGSVGTELDVGVGGERYVLGRMQRTPTTVAIRKSNRLTKEPDRFQARVESIFIYFIICVRRAEADALLGFLPFLCIGICLS